MGYWGLPTPAESGIWALPIPESIKTAWPLWTGSTFWRASMPARARRATLRQWRSPPATESLPSGAATRTRWTVWAWDILYLRKTYAVSLIWSGWWRKRDMSFAPAAGNTMPEPRSRRSEGQMSCLWTASGFTIGWEAWCATERGNWSWGSTIFA